jgi:hypothetical protein
LNSESNWSGDVGFFHWIAEKWSSSYFTWNGVNGFEFLRFSAKYAVSSLGKNYVPQVEVRSFSDGKDCVPQV